MSFSQSLLDALSTGHTIVYGFFFVAIVYLWYKNQQISRMNPSLNVLLSRGCPRLNLIRFCKSSVSRIWSHLPIEKEISGVLRLIHNLLSFCDKFNLDYQPSFLLRNTSAMRDADGIQVDKYRSQNVVEGILLDVLYIAGLGRNMMLTRQDPRGGDSEDIWLVTDTTQRLVLTVLVKSPVALPSCSVSILEDPLVMGEVVDYMLEAQSYYGVEDVFCVVTSLEHWKVCWFPHSDVVAAATVLKPLPPAAEQQIHIAAQRAVSSVLYHHTDPDLIRALVSVLLKAVRSKYQVVSPFDALKWYVQLSTKKWEWHRFSQDAMASITTDTTLCMTKITKKTKRFTVVKDFCRSNKQRVFLALTDDHSLVVVKQTTDESEAASECLLWHRVNDAKTAFVTVVGGEPALCMPLVIHATLRISDTGDEHVFFESNLQCWLTQAGAHAGELPSHLRQCSQDLSDLLARQPGLRDARLVAHAAIKKAAQRRIVHLDLEWRHVALLPVFDEARSRVVDLAPVLIDFGMVQKVASVEEALAIMSARIDDLVLGLRFF